jgi:hypothetical protein
MDIRFGDRLSLRPTLGVQPVASGAVSGVTCRPAGRRPAAKHQRLRCLNSNCAPKIARHPGSCALIISSSD